MLLLQHDWHSPPSEAGPIFFPLNLGELKTAPTKEFWGYQAKEIVSPWFSLSGHSPLELSHDAANKPKLVHAERLHGGAHVERNCGPKWHLVATASWVHEPSDDSSSQLHIFYLMSPTLWGRTGNPCCVLSKCIAHRIWEYNKLPYNYVCFIPLTCGIIC